MYVQSLAAFGRVGLGVGKMTVNCRNALKSNNVKLNKSKLY